MKNFSEEIVISPKLERANFCLMMHLIEDQLLKPK